ncbi:MAG: recombinase family protein [Pseudomonadales bacterium]
MVKTVAYIRVSTQGQAEDGVSLDMQQTKIEAWCNLHDAELVGSFADKGISGMKSDRPGFIQAVEAAKQAKAALVVYSISRLSRSTIDLLTTAEDLQKAGCHLVSLSEQIDTGSAAGQMVFRMLSAMAQFERDLTSERTCAALAHKKSKGERVGSIPHGFKLGSDRIRLVRDETGQSAVLLAKRLRSEGQTFQAIADQLTARGIKNRRGAEFKPMSVRNMVLAV